MSRRPAAITQADVARAIRAAKQAGAAEVEIRSADGSKIVIRIASSTSGPDRFAQKSVPANPGSAWGREQTAVAARAGSISTVSALVSLDHPYRK